MAGGGVAADKFAAVRIDGSSLVGNVAGIPSLSEGQVAVGDAAGVYAAGHSSVWIAASTLRENAAQRRGGAVGTEADARVAVDGTVLEGNAAISANSASLGAGIFVEKDACGGIALANSSVLSNRAQFGGGGVYVNTPDLSACASFSALACAAYAENTAAYGPACATPTERIVPELLSRPINVASGKPILFEVTMKDAYGSIVADTGSFIQISASSTSLTGTTTNATLNGVALLSDVRLIEMPGAAYNLSFFVADRQLQPAPLSVFLRECIPGEILDLVARICSECGPNFYSLDPQDAACSRCPEGAICDGGARLYAKEGWFQSTFDPNIFIECLNGKESCLGGQPSASSSSPLLLANDTSCPRNATGQGEATTSNTTLCPTRAAGRRNLLAILVDTELESQYVSKCKPGYEGQLCGVCVNGFGRAGDYACTECLSPSASAAIGFLVALAFLFFAGYITWTTIKDASNTDDEEKRGIFLQILLEYLQLITLSKSLSVRWPSVLNGLLGAEEAMVSPMERVVNLDCVLGLTREGHSGIRPVFAKLLFYILLPMAAFMMQRIRRRNSSLNAAIPTKGEVDSRKQASKRAKSKGAGRARSVIVNDGKASKGDELEDADAMLEAVAEMDLRKGSFWENAKHIYVVGAIVLVFFFQPMITSKLTSLFGCVDVGGGVSLLARDPSVDCASAEYRSWIYGVDVPFLVIYGVGVPAGTAIFLWVYRDRIRDDQDREFRLYFSFLYRGYKRERFWFAFVSMIQKTALAVCMALFSERPLVQALMGAFVLFAGLVLHMKIQPRSNARIGSIDVACQMGALVTIWLGIFLFPDAGLSEEQKNFVAALGFISNIAFVAILILLFLFGEERVFEKLRIVMPWMAAPPRLLSDSKPADGETNANGGESIEGAVFSNLDGDGDGDGDHDELQQQLEPDRPGYQQGRGRRPLDWATEERPAESARRARDDPSAAAGVPPLWHIDAADADGEEGRVSTSQPPPPALPVASLLLADELRDRLGRLSQLSVSVSRDTLAPPPAPGAFSAAASPAATSPGRAPSIAVSRPSSVFEFDEGHFDLVVETPGGARGAADLRPPASSAGTRTPSPTAGVSPRSGSAGSERSAHFAGRRQ
eukprot:tig00000042_g15595.t1